LFNKLGFQIQYDKKFFNAQRPDWTIFAAHSTAICEIYRLGKSENDQIRCDFENQLIQELQKLQFEYFIKVHFIEEYFDPLQYSVDVIVNEIRNWLSLSSRKLEEKFIVQVNFEFEIRKTNTDINHICCVGNSNSIEMKPNKLRQYEHLKPNEITKKLKKYDEIISKEQLPYFIGVSIDFVSGFDHNDFTEYFLGKGVEFADFGKPIAELEQFKHFGKIWTELGEFYNNPQLSGVITLYGNKFSLLINPNQNQAIHLNKYFAIKEKLMSLSWPALIT
jgi:hypothetical protein